MAASQGISLIKNLIISTTSTGLVDASGNPLATANIVGSGNYAYSPTMELSPKSIEHVLTAICDGCTIEVKLEISPDGINWCDCTLSSGSVCQFECTAVVGDCTTQIIDVSLLQFVRVKIGNAGSTGGNCTININFTLN